MVLQAAQRKSDDWVSKQRLKEGIILAAQEEFGNLIRNSLPGEEGKEQ